MDTFCGYIALLGRPNAGKSTLLNACLGQKIAGVSQKPQTTRNRIVGIDTMENRQMVFLDTPGLHKSQGKPRINQMMNREAWSVLADADLICYLVDAKAGWHQEDRQFLTSLLDQTAKPILLLATKVDAAKKFVIAEHVSTIAHQVAEVLAEKNRPAGAILCPCPVELSAKRPEDVLSFRARAAEYMPVGPFLYDPENLTDRSQEFVVGEMIREQIFRQLGEELPYGTGVIIDEIGQSGKTVKVSATIIVSRATHKPMVIGAQGRTIKSIGSAARATLEKHFDAPVFLDLFVRVQPNWMDDSALISEFQGMTL